MSIWATHGRLSTPMGWTGHGRFVKTWTLKTKLKCPPNHIWVYVKA
jgi:hypothetical protein